MKLVYFFGGGQVDGGKELKDTLGGKGANLAEMSKMGISIPPGFTISTEVCNAYFERDERYRWELQAQVEEALARLETIMGARYGDREKPLLLSVRSGARVSMPGMMDTVLNLGLNDETVQGLAESANDEWFAYDSYRRFIQIYGNVVMRIPGDLLEQPLEEKKRQRGIGFDTELTLDDLKEVVGSLKAKIEEATGEGFPHDPREQLWKAISAVFESWNTPRAITYRKLNDIPDHWGTAATVQAMVFGNMGNDSATGVAFTRDPATGEKGLYGEYLINAQGEDVVAGIRTPKPIRGHQGAGSLEEVMPEIYRQLSQTATQLEEHFRDVQDFEFTIQRARLWILQTRDGKRTAQAAVKMAVDMVDEGLIQKEEALRRVEPKQLEQLLHPSLDPKAEKRVIAKGLPASPGAASGKVVFDPEEAVRLAQEGEKVILVRHETSADDVHGMSAARGILTARGGMTSHAAVVARGMGKSCVAGCAAIAIDYKKQRFEVDGLTVSKGDVITLDGGTGEVILGEVPTIAPEVKGELGRLLDWADEVARLKVKANADSPSDARLARSFGAKGIGLCRTEHMFFQPERLLALRRGILAGDDREKRIEALAEILPMQREDFLHIFREMEGLPVAIRLLDPPLHEFLVDERGLQALAEDMELPVEELRAKVEALREANPMLGHRGCRLGITVPELSEIQVQAIMEAACQLRREEGRAIPEIMIPLIAHVGELKVLKDLLVSVCERVKESQGVTDIDYRIGIMVELPRAAITASQLAPLVNFFSFGTNDLTQTVFGLSRDDSATFLPYYLEKGILSRDPFITLDQTGVGELMETGVRRGREANPELEIGICGEHGGDPESIEFCHRAGLDYVSCSPYRVPIARLACAQAALKDEKVANRG